MVRAQPGARVADWDGDPYRGSHHRLACFRAAAGAGAGRPRYAAS